MSLAAIMIKELRQLVRDKRSMLIIVSMPLVVMLLFGLAYGGKAGRIPLAAINLDSKGALSWQLINMVKSSGQVEFIAYLNSREKALELIESGEIYGAILIPEDFTSNLYSREPVEVEVISDESSPLTSQIITQLTRETIFMFQQKIAEKINGFSIRTFHTTVYGPSITRMENFMPLVMVILLFLVPLILISISICRERERGTYEQLIVTPVSRWSIITGKLFAYFIATLADLLFTLLTAVYVFDVRVRGPLSHLIILSSIFLACSLSVGMLLSVISKNQLQAQQIATFVFIPTLFYSGLFTPVETISPDVRGIAYFLPTTYFVKAFKKIMIRGLTIYDVTYECLVISFMTLVFLIASITSLRMRL